MLGGGVGMPILASVQGWGLASERNAQIIQQSEQYCPPGQRNTLAGCRNSHRSYYFGRSHIGGGPGYGK